MLWREMWVCSRHHVEMFDKDVYCPENAKGFAQCLILSLLLHKMKETISNSDSTVKNINMYVATVIT